MRKEVQAFNLNPEITKKIRENAKEQGISISKYLNEFLAAQFLITPREIIKNNLDKIETITEHSLNDDNGRPAVKLAVEQIRIELKKIL